jgi:4-carboxymuconolactone decarboxylase
VDDQRRFDQGMTVRRAVLGDAHVDQATAATTDFTADFQNLITRYAWGDIWSRPGLDRRTRSCITLAMLAAMGLEEELAMHVRAALRSGLTTDEIKGVLLQVAVYAGVPAANHAFRAAQQASMISDRVREVLSSRYAPSAVPGKSASPAEKVLVRTSSTGAEIPPSQTASQTVKCSVGHCRRPRRTAQQHFRCSEACWWARQGLNLRPLPCQQTTGGTAVRKPVLAGRPRP